MNILITGGTGLIGQALCRKLASKHSLTVYSRRPERVAMTCGKSVKAIGDLDEWTAEQTFDAIINLSGEPIVGPRWTEARKRTLRQSRIDVTDKLIEKMRSSNTRPGVFISGSAIGFYGDTENLEIDESAPAQSDFGSTMCQQWETAASAAEALQIRTCLIRTGLVLSNRGGMLKPLLVPFKMALGARLGSGNQWMSWIHIDDQVNAICHLLERQDCRGSYNLTAPTPVTNQTFTQTLAKTLARPAFLAIPSWALKLFMGESSALLIGGQRVMPTRLRQSGFVFRFVRLDSALKNLLK